MAAGIARSERNSRDGRFTPDHNWGEDSNPRRGWLVKIRSTRFQSVRVSARVMDRIVVVEIEVGVPAVQKRSRCLLAHGP